MLQCKFETSDDSAYRATFVRGILTQLSEIHENPINRKYFTFASMH